MKGKQRKEKRNDQNTGNPKERREDEKPGQEIKNYSKEEE